MSEINFTKSSIAINNEVFINNIISDPDFPWLISFPRTGSHWLRVLMELYFKKPSLVRSFYYTNATDFTCYHQHDEDLEIQNINNVIYLYRMPVYTVFSQMKYYKENLNDLSRIQYWSKLYGQHVSKWLFEENFTQKKTIITYEGLKDNLENEFKKITDHFSVAFNNERISNIASQVSKEKIKGKTKHDSQVINISDEYFQLQKVFINKYYNAVLDMFYSQSNKLEILYSEH